MMQRATERIININGIANWELRDASGHVKRLWDENRLGKFARLRLGIDMQGHRLFGRWAERVVRANTITNVGHAALNGRASNQGSYNPFTNLALGTSTQGSPSTATALATEIT